MTNSLDLGAYRYDEGYFLLRGSGGTSPYLPGTAGTGHYRHVFSYRGSRPTIKEAALELLSAARERVFVASFRIGDTDLLKALYDAVDRLRGGVYVVSALDERSLRKGLQTEDADAPGADDIRAQNKRFEDMTSRGISVRGHENFHAKFLVVDDRIALVSSANLETSALADTESRGATGENGFIVSERNEVLRLARYFARLWHHCTYEMPPGEDHTVQERTASRGPADVPVADLEHTPGVIWTYDGELGIRDAIHDVIGRARRTLLLASYSLNGLIEHPELLLAPVERAMRAHSLQVSLLVRARNNHPPTRHGATALAELGVHICADSLTHAKAAIADDRYGALFSANFDADHGLLSGAEVGVRIDCDLALDEAVRHLQHAITHSDLTFTLHPTQRAMDRGLGAWWRTTWPLDSELAIIAAEPIWRQFVAASKTGPVLYSAARNELLRLYAGDSEWTLTQSDANGDRILKHAGKSTHQNTKLRLDEWLTARPQQTSQGRRGFCPAVLTRQMSDSVRQN
jgi:phosphatidylserine/phosphatidylglycerophosphate/cardiolipin synthase-like enzyme